MRLLLAIFASSIIAAGPPVRQKPQTVPDFTGGPYCGIYCVYAALRSHGLPVRFDDLVSPRYVGSAAGSTAGELALAVEEAGGKTAVVQQLDAAALRSATQPIILHVRRPGYQTPHAHWILFMGVEDGVARIVDPPHAVETLPFADLLSLWDGVGIVVGQVQVDTVTPRIGSWVHHGAWFAAALAGLAMLRFVPRNWPAALLHVPLLAGFLAGIQHAVLVDGMLGHREALGQVVCNHFQSGVRKVALAEARAWHKEGSVVFVDARGPGAFNLGHIPGAVNLPVYAGLAERRRILDTIRPGVRIVVYCQSLGCDWGESVAADLAARGQAQVVLYPGGWREWSAHDPENN